MSSIVKLCIVAFLILSIRSEILKEHAQVVQATEDNYYQSMIAMGIQCPRVVVAQMVHETSWMSSKIYRENHNLFGMKYNRRGHALGVRNGHAYYADKYGSLADYRDWQAQMANGRVFHSDEEYMDFLNNLPGGRRYAEDPKYTDKLNRIIHKYLL